MFDLFARLLGRSSHKEGFHLYERDSYPSAIQGPIFTEATIDQLSLALTRSGKSWIFESTRTGQPPGNVDLAPPEHRERQQLTLDSHFAFSADLVERNVHGFRRFVALYGGSTALLDLTDDEHLFAAVEAFAQGRESPIDILIVQFGDVVPDVVYYYPGKDSKIETLLQDLAIITDGDNIFRHDYKNLKGEDLDTAITYLSCAEHDH